MGVPGSSAPPPVFRDGVLYVARVAVDGLAGVAALSGVDGQVLWHGRLSSDAAPAVGDGMVFAASSCGANTAWRTGSGERVWFHICEMSGGSHDRTPVLADGLLWVRMLPSRLPTAFDARTGAEVVTFTADASPAFDGQRGYFLDRGVLHARVPRTQEPLWSFSGDGRLVTAPIVVNGYVYMASESGRVWALDAASGAVAWSDAAGAPVLRAVEGNHEPRYVGLGAGQGIVAVPASTHLVAYADAATAISTARASSPPAVQPAAGEAPSTAPPDEAWGPRIDAAHQGNLDSGIEVPPLRKRWTRDLGALSEYALLADGRVFVAAGAHLFALDTLTGENLWDPVYIGADMNPASQVAYGEGRVFAAGRVGPVRAFDAATGRELWSFSGAPNSSFTAPPVFDRGLVYVADSHGYVRALSAATGEERWNAYTAGARDFPPAVAGGLVVAAGGAAVDALTGAKAWEPTLGWLAGPSRGSAVNAGQLWASLAWGTPKVRDAATGKLTGAFSGSLPAFDATRTYTLDGTALKARDRNHGFTRWTFVGDGELATKPVVVNGRVYVASATGRIWAVDGATGEAVWTDHAGVPLLPGGIMPGVGVGPNITAGQGLVTVPASNLLVAYEPVPGPGGGFHPLDPARILDTRSGLGAPAAKVGPGATLGLQVAGRGGVPTTGVSAVAVNVTVTNPTAGSHLTAWPAGRARPLASNLNFTAGQTVPNMVVVKVGEAGKVNLFNAGGSTDVVVDVGGGYVADDDPDGARYTPVEPARTLDTRTGPGPLGPARTRSVQVTGEAASRPRVSRPWPSTSP
jgi:outer membrane protein assembly factor BamB